MKKATCRKPIALLVLCAMMLFATAFCTTLIQAADKTELATAGQTLYTRYTLFYENHKHRTTNYRKGTLVPVNTVVKFVKADSDSIVVTLPDGQDLTIENIQSYSGEGIEGIFSRTFSSKPLNLSVFNEMERKAIMAGEVKPGMRKAAVIVALGYPPKHKTASLELNQWQYWRNRFNTFIVYFEKNKVTSIKD